MTAQALPAARARPFLREIRALVPLALPLILGQLFGIGTDVIISIFAGHLGADVLAAVALGSSLWIVVFVAVIGLMMALQPAVSALDGAGRRQEAGHLLGQGLMLGLAAGLLGGLLLAFGGPAFARATHLPPAVLSGVAGFLHAAAWSMPALGLLAACRGLSEGLSMTRPTMICGALGLAALGPAAYVLVDGANIPWLGSLPALGAEGAGLTIRAASSGSRPIAYLGWVRFSGRYPATAWHRGRVGAGLAGARAPDPGRRPDRGSRSSSKPACSRWRRSWPGDSGPPPSPAHQIALMTSAVFFHGAARPVHGR